MNRDRSILTEDSLRPLTDKIIGAAIEVHRQIGPGLLESAYEACLFRELDLRGISAARQVPLPLIYKGIDVECGYRIDILVEDRLILELKSVDRLEQIHRAQMLTYLKLTGLPLGLVINFNTLRVVSGIMRVALDLPEK